MILALLKSDMILPELLATQSAHLSAHAKIQVQSISLQTEKNKRAEHSCGKRLAGSSLQEVIKPYVPKRFDCMQATIHSKMQVHKARQISSTFSMSLGCSLADLALAFLLLPSPCTSNRPGHSCAISSALSPVIGCTCDTPLSTATAQETNAPVRN